MTFAGPCISAGRGACLSPGCLHTGPARAGDEVAAAHVKAAGALDAGTAAHDVSASGGDCDTAGEFSLLRKPAWPFSANPPVMCEAL